MKNQEAYENVNPYENSPLSKKSQVIKLFDSISDTYDILYDKPQLTFSKGMQINTDLSVNKTIDCSAINANQIIFVMEV